MPRRDTATFPDARQRNDGNMSPESRDAPTARSSPAITVANSVVAAGSPGCLRLMEKAGQEKTQCIGPRGVLADRLVGAGGYAAKGLRYDISRQHPASIPKNGIDPARRRCDAPPSPIFQLAPKPARGAVMFEARARQARGRGLSPATRLLSDGGSSNLMWRPCTCISPASCRRDSARLTVARLSPR